MNTATAARRNGDKPFVLTHLFDAPRERVWRAWTDAAELQRWFGPTGTTMPICKLDLRSGGTCHYCMRTADGQDMWGKQTFREVVAPQRIVLIQSFSDAQGGITRHPMAPTWPQETHSTATFTAQGGKTALEIRWLVWNGSEEEHRTFDAAHDGMRGGWGGTMTRLVEHLAKGTP